MSETLQGLRHQQLWMNFEHTDPPPIEALDDLMVRRRAVIEAIERELLVREAQRRGLTLQLEELRAWVQKQIPGADRPRLEALDDLIRARLKLAPGASLGAFWQAAERVALVERLRERMSAELSEEEARQEWLKRGRLIAVELLLIPRVPTSDEITAALGRLQTEMKAYYDEHQALFSQADRALVTPIFFSGGKGERERKKLLEVQAQLSQGRSLDELKSELPTLQVRAKKSLSARLLPKKSQLEVGAVTRPRITRFGWTIYQIHRVDRGYTRSFEERSVQRECASAVLIERDELPKARALAERGRQLLAVGSPESLSSWAKSSRAHLKRPAPFFANPNQVIPMLGTAPELHDKLFKAQVGEVSELTPIRQSYVVAKLVSRQEQSGDWGTARADFMKKWRAERERKLLNEWLSASLKDQPRWVSSSQLKALDTSALKAPLSISLSHEPSAKQP